MLSYPRSVNSVSEGLDRVFMSKASDLVVLATVDQRSLRRNQDDHKNTHLWESVEDGGRAVTSFKVLCWQGNEKVKARGCFFFRLMFF